eukprot:scaffold857_cov152-Ochromonas_danica.AAC.16
MASNVSYVPQNPLEKEYYELLWAAATENSSDPAVELSGKNAVMFFERSSVDKGFLKQIWSLSTPLATMNHSQFFSALRFITMIQNGEIPISAERLLKTSKVDLGLPKFNGIDLPSAKPSNRVPPSAGLPHAAFPAGAAPFPVAPAAAAAFAITPIEHAKYHNLFIAYDADKDGFLSRDEVWGVLKQSGLDGNSLERIWTMADADKDLRLSSKEFCVAFHLIVGITKRGQAVPEALPQSLHQFLLLAPPIPPVDATVVAGDSAQPSPASSGKVAPPASVPVPAPLVSPSIPAAQPIAVAPNGATAVASVATKKLSTSDKISAEFDIPASHPVTTSAPVSGAVQSSSVKEDEIIDAIDGVRSVARKAVVAHEHAVETVDKAFASLIGLRQRLATEKISLEATVANAVAANNETAGKLERVLAEVAKLQEELQELRNKFASTSANQGENQERLAKVVAEKTSLLREINELVERSNHSNNANADYSNKIVEATASFAQIQQQVQTSSAKQASLASQCEAIAKENESLKQLVAKVRANLSASNQQSSALDAKLKSLQARSLEEQRVFEQTKQKVAELELKLAALQREKQNSLLQLVNAANDRVGSTVSSVKSNSTSAKNSDWNSSSKDAFDGNAFSSAGDVDTSDHVEKEDGAGLGGYQAFEEDQEALISPALIKSSTESLPSADSSSAKSSQSAKIISNAPLPSSSVKSVTNIELPIKNLSDSDPFGELSAPETHAAHDDPFGAKTVDSALTTTTKGPFDDNGSSDYAIADPFGAVDATHAADPFGTSLSDGGAATNNATSATADPFGDVESTSTVGVDPFGELTVKHVDSTVNPFSEPGVVSAKSAGPTAAAQGAEVPTNIAPSSNDSFDAVSVGDASTASEAEDDNPFGATSSKIGGTIDLASDPFGEAGAGITEDDPFGAADSSAADPFGSVPAAAVSASDPFGASDAKPAVEGDPFGAASATAADPFLASPTAPNDASVPAVAISTSDPFGGSDAKAAVEGDPFGAASATAADPFLASPTAPNDASVPAVAISTSDPFGGSDAKAAVEGDPFGAASATAADPFLASPTAPNDASVKHQDSGFNAFSDASAAAFEFDSANSAPFDASAFDGFDAFGDNAPADHSEKEKFSDSNPFGHEGPDPFNF